MDRGGCRVETRTNQIDATTQTLEAPGRIAVQAARLAGMSFINSEMRST
jgi:hypothetical protein